MLSSWQRRRSAFNHDWLKNQYMPALAKVINVIDDKVEDPGFVKEFVTSILPAWESQREEVLSIIRDCERELSPAVLFQRSRLVECDPYTKDWLGEFVHALWLRKNSISETMSAALSAVEHVDSAYRFLVAKFGVTGAESPNELQERRCLFVDFRKACQRLAIVIESFPSKIRLT